jgi:hypothetical protein
MSLIKALATSLILACSIQISGAATLTFDDHGGIHFDGPIAPGDAETLIDRQRAWTAKNGEPLRIAYLSSSGGSLSEAIKLALLVEAFRLDVKVPAGAHCASSCFLMYVAGSARVAMGNAASAIAGRVGVHRPYIDRTRIQDRDLPRIESEQRKLMLQMQTFLRERSVPQDLIEKMMRYSSQEVYWLDDADIATSLGGFSPAYDDLIVGKCGRSPDIGRQLMNPSGSRNAQDIIDSMGELNECQSRVMKDLRSKEIPPMLERMKRGWRPWF